MDEKKIVKMLFIFGSHRSNGNSEMVKALMERHPDYGDVEAKYIFLKDYDINDCKSCYQCTELGKCSIDDDVEKIVDEMKESDAIIFVPVVYGFGTGSIFQKFIERAGYGFLRMQGRPLRDKIAGIVVVGRRYAHEAVVQQIIMNVLLNEMVIYGSGFLPLLKGNSFPGNIMEDEEGIESFDKMVNRVVDAVKKGKR